MALSDLALKRGRMSDWAEQKVQNANSIKDVRQAAKQVKKDNEKLLLSHSQMKKREVKGNSE